MQEWPHSQSPSKTRSKTEIGLDHGRFTNSKGEHLQTPFGVCNTVEDNKRVGFQWVSKPISKYATFALQLQMIGISVDKYQRVLIKIE